MTDVEIQGSCASGFERVHDAFEQNFAVRDEVGAAVAVYVDGDLVVDLWGGWADASRSRPWRQDTLAALLSATKGLTSTCVHQAVERGELDLYAPVARYWPEFGQAGKEAITIAMVMSHRSGVIGPRTRLRWQDVADWDLVCERLAAAEPWWEPGTAQGYHAVSFGFILGEVFRRATGLTIGQYLRTEIAEPLGIDVHIGLPVSEHHRCAEMVNQSQFHQTLLDAQAPAGSPVTLADHPKAGVSVALGLGFVPDEALRANAMQLWREIELPASNAHVSALGLATFYNALAQEQLLSRRHMELIRMSQGGVEPDLVLGSRVADHGWGLGYMLNQRRVVGPNPRIFGHGGSGGAFGFVDLEHRIGYAYVMNYYDITQANADPRSVALIDEVYAALGVTRN
ncbi:MAG: beta-lactamase family protein [Mycobacterium sp.]|nr:beta-lactamase family protein [Mycobacterium sp.]